ncbi:MAG: ankyrin repeat domain-containing protein, partial [Gammaproteobacteria bacterium]|nr:ankyrin repeat domain-containing protein [Gammaproteobacteria bacterium]
PVQDSDGFVGENGTTALVYAARGGYLNVVRMLLDAGARQQIGWRTGRGTTAISEADQRGHSAVVQLLRKADTAY